MKIWERTESITPTTSNTTSERTDNLENTITTEPAVSISLMSSNITSKRYENLESTTRTEPAVSITLTSTKKSQTESDSDKASKSHPTNSDKAPKSPLDKCGKIPEMEKESPRKKTLLRNIFSRKDENNSVTMQKITTKLVSLGKETSESEASGSEASKKTSESEASKETNDQNQPSHKNFDP